MKYTKYIMWVMILISVCIAVWAFQTSFTGATVDTLLYWGYILVGTGILAIVGFGLGYAAIVNPKSLIKIFGVIAGVAALVAVSYFLAKGEPVNIIGARQPSDGELKFVETILNLTYIALGASVCAILFGICVNFLRSK